MAKLKKKKYFTTSMDLRENLKLIKFCGLFDSLFSENNEILLN